MQKMPYDVEILQAAIQEGFSKHQEILNYCDTRNSAEEGIPAIIGLSDLREGGRKVFQSTPQDEKLRAQLGMEATILNYLIFQKTQAGDRYPSIAGAMSALAEKCFLWKDGENRPISYQELLKECEV